MGLTNTVLKYTKPAADNKFVAISSADIYEKYTVTSTNITLSSNQKYCFDTTSGTLTATLPANPIPGDEIYFFDYHGMWSDAGNYNLIINNNGKPIEQLNDKMLCNTRFASFKLVYSNVSADGWKIVSLFSPVTMPVYKTPSTYITTTSKVTGYVPLTVYLTGNNSLPIYMAPVDNWYWNLTSGNTVQLTSQAVTYTYTNSGNYTAFLSGINTSGYSVTSLNISAYPIVAPSVKIVKNTSSGTAPLSVNFQGTSLLPSDMAPVTNWYWNLTSGNDAQFTTQNTSYNYTSAATYTITLTGTNSAGISIDTTSITVISIPVSPLIFWKLDNTADASGNGNTLTNNGATFVAGKIGNAAQFNGSTTYLNLPSFSSTFDTSKEYSISIWAYPTTLKNYLTLVGNSNTGTLNIHSDSGGALYWNNAASGDVSVSGFFSANTWVHLVCIRTAAGRMQVWKNGTRVYDSPGTASYGVVSFLDVGILTSYGSTFAFPGKLDAIGIWTRALTDAEVATLYNGGAGLEP